MLNKAILLNLNIAKNDMSIVLWLLIIFLFIFVASLNSIFFPGIWLLLIALIIYSVFYIRIINKVFFTSFFDDEGMMYMTLPIPAKDMILGKILAVSGFSTVVQLVFYGGITGSIMLSEMNTDILMTTLSNELPSLTGTQIETSIVFALLPVATFVSSLFSSAFILAIFLRFGLQKKKLLPCWIMYLMIVTILNLGLEQLGKFLENITLGVVVDSLIQILIYLAFTFFLVKFSVKNLEERYDV